MSELFGAPVGTSIGEQQKQTADLTALRMASGLQGLQQNEQLFPLQLQEHRLKADSMQMDIDQRNAMIRYMQANPPTGDESPSDLMDRFARAEMAGGNSKAATAAFTASSRVLKDAQLAKESGLRQQLDGYKIEEQFAGNMAMWANGVTDQAGYDAFKQKVVAAWDGNPEQQERARAAVATWPQAYTPEALNGIKMSGLSAKEGFAKQRAEAEADSRKELRDAHIEHWKIKEDLDKQLMGLRERREVRMEKGAGTKAITGPKKEDIDQAFNLIVQEYPEFKEDKDPAALSAAYDIAQRAKGMVRDNPGLDMGTALHRAMQEAADSGELAHTSVPKKFLGVPIGEEKKATYRQQGKTPDKPAPMSDSMTDNDLIKDRYYTWKGTTRQYLGKGKWGPATAGQQAKPEAGTYKGAPDDEDDEDEDTLE